MGGARPTTCATAFPWDSEEKCIDAGGRLHTLQGLVRIVTPRDEKTSGRVRSRWGILIWHNWYEAEQHLLYLGRAEEPVCWTLTGFASGYLSRAHGRQIYCPRRAVPRKGGAVCRLIGRPVEEWGGADKLAPRLLPGRCLDAALSKSPTDFQAYERRLRAKRTEAGWEQRDQPVTACRRALRWRASLESRAVSRRWIRPSLITARAASARSAWRA